MPENREKKNARDMAYKKEHYTRFSVVYKHDEAEAIKAHAAARGEGVGAFIRRACAEQIKRDDE